MRAALFATALVLSATTANAQGPLPDQEMDGWSPVPPLNEHSVGNYCVHRNLLYSIGDVLCVGGQGLVCVPAPPSVTGGRAYWSSVPVSRGDVNWTPPAHCGR